MRINYDEEISNDRITIYPDESIIPTIPLGANFDLYFKDFSHGVSIERLSGKIVSVMGSQCGFGIKNCITIPKSKKGVVYIDKYLLDESDGTYYSLKNYKKFEADYDPNTGIYMFGDDSEIGLVIEFSTNSFINIIDNEIRTIWFRGFNTE